MLKLVEGDLASSVAKCLGLKISIENRMSAEIWPLSGSLRYYLKEIKDEEKFKIQMNNIATSVVVTKEKEKIDEARRICEIGGIKDEKEAGVFMVNVALTEIINNPKVDASMREEIMMRLGLKESG